MKKFILVVGLALSFYSLMPLTTYANGSGKIDPRYFEQGHLFDVKKVGLITVDGVEHILYEAVTREGVVITYWINDKGEAVTVPNK